MGCLDSNPRSIAGILVALGLFGIGVVLTFGFFDNATLLGVGVTMIVLGAAGLLLGILHMCSQDQTGRKRTITDNEIAPPRIPKEVPKSKTARGLDDEDEDPDGALYYPECSVSPPRNRDLNLSGGDYSSPNRDGALVVPTQSGGLAMLSPYERKSFPVPVTQRGDTPGQTNRSVVIEKYSPTHSFEDPNAHHRQGSVSSAAFKGQQLHGQLEAPHPAETNWTRGNDPRHSSPTKSVLHNSPPRHTAVSFQPPQQESPPPPIQEQGYAAGSSRPLGTYHDPNAQRFGGGKKLDYDSRVTVTNSNGAISSRPLPTPAVGDVPPPSHSHGRRFTDGTTPDAKRPGEQNGFAFDNDDDMLSPGYGGRRNDVL